MLHLPNNMFPFFQNITMDKRISDPLVNKSEDYAPSHPLNKTSGGSSSHDQPPEYGSLMRKSQSSDQEKRPFMDSASTLNQSQQAADGHVVSSLIDPDDPEVAIDGGATTLGMMDTSSPNAATSTSAPPDVLSRCGLRCTAVIAFVQGRVHGFFSEHGRLLKIIALIVLLVGYLLYFAFAIWYSPWGAIVLIVLTVLVVLTWTIKLVNRHWGKDINSRVCLPITNLCQRPWWRHIRRQVGFLFYPYNTLKNKEINSSFIMVDL